MAVAPITVVSGGQDFLLIVTDTNSAEMPVYSDAALSTRLTQPYPVKGHASFTAYRPLAASSETAVVTVLVAGEPTQGTYTLTSTGSVVSGATVTLAGAPGAALGNHPGLGTDGHLYPA